MESVSTIQHSTSNGLYHPRSSPNRIEVGRCSKDRSKRAMIDTALQERESNGRPIRVGMIGAGATGRAIALQLGTPVPGIRLVAIANRTPEHAERALREANMQDWSRVSSVRGAEAAIARGTPVLVEDP